MRAGQSFEIVPAFVAQRVELRRMNEGARQTIDGLGPSASNTVVLAVPVEMFENLAAIRDGFRNRTPADSVATTQA